MSRLFTQTAIQAAFQQQIEVAQERETITALALTPSSDQYSETYRWLNPAPAPQKWRGERRTKQVTARGVTINNDEWENSVSFFLPDVRRAIDPSMLNNKMQELATRLAVLQWALICDVIKNGDTTAYTGYDGKKLFDTTHSDGASGTQINDLAAAQVADLDVTTPTAPTADEFAKALVGVWAYQQRFLDAEGEPINEMGKKFIVMTTPALASPLLQALTRENLAFGATNPLLGLIKGGYQFVPVVTPRLDWTTEFALFRTDSIFKTLILQEENPASVDMLGEGSEHAFKTNHILVGGKWSGGVGIARWETASKATFS